VPAAVLPPATRRGDVLSAAAGVLAVAALSVACRLWLGITNATTIALSLLLIVLVVAATSRLWAAVTASIAAMLCFNYFFLPPVGTLTIADPQNWVALFTFLAVSLVASHLSTLARTRAEEALARRDELARLFDLSCDVLMVTDSGDAFPALARLVARRFSLEYVAICLPHAAEWTVAEAGSLMLSLDTGELSSTMARVGDDVEAANGARVAPRQLTVESRGHTVVLVPLRFGTRVVGLLAAGGRPVEAGTLDALAGVVAIAMERAQFLEERKAAELSRQSEELKSALLASLAHDLRTPLTAIRVGAANLQASWLTDDDRREQSGLILTEVERLTRMFQNILDMARIDAGAVGAELRWAHPSEIVEAAQDQVTHALERHVLDVEAVPDLLVRVDPRLTAAALAHLLENAAQYSPPGTAIVLTTAVTRDGLVLTVRDHGPGIASEDLPHLFERFYRGQHASSRPSGTGMGLSIAKGLLAAEHGRLAACNAHGGGAAFTIVVPTSAKEPTVASDG
jgi:two-component system sensor histidine kinase KdpD